MKDYSEKYGKQGERMTVTESDGNITGWPWDHMRTWISPNKEFGLDLYDANRREYGNSLVGFKLFDKGELIFKDTMRCPVGETLDGDGMVRAALSITVSAFCMVEWSAERSADLRDAMNVFGRSVGVYEDLAGRVSPMVKSNIRDIEEHDHNAITGYGVGCSFLHWAGEMGTHIVILLPASHKDFPAKGERVQYLFGVAGRLHILNEMVTMAEYLETDETSFLCHYWNGEELKQIQLRAAVSIAEQHREFVVADWRRQDDAN